MTALDPSFIVVSRDAAPSGMDLTETITGRAALVEQLRSPGALDRIQAQSGFVAGLLRVFSGEGGAVLSLALQFATQDDAQEAFAIYLDELRSDDAYGFGTGPDAGLGDEGQCVEGPNPYLGGLPEAICLWRNGSFVLIAGGPSGGPRDVARVRSIAEGMDSRADSDP